MNTDTYKPTAILLAFPGVLYVAALCGHFMAMYLSMVMARIKYVQFCKANNATNAEHLHSIEYHSCISRPATS